MLTIKQAALKMGVCNKTLRRWEKRGFITPFRTLGGHRRYTMNMINMVRKDYQNNKDRRQNQKKDKITIIYSRVSSHDQKKNGDLDRQEMENITFCEKNKFQRRILIKDTGSGLNTKRPGLRKIIKTIKSTECARVVITYRDRLTRFGFEYLQELFATFGVEIIETKSKKDKTVQEELVQDMMSLIACFSGRLYGMRSKKKKKRENEKKKKDSRDKRMLKN